MKKRKCCTRIFAVLAVITVLMGSLMLPIGAAAPPTWEPETIPFPPDYTSPIDWSIYPGANLLPYPFATTTKTENGITFIDNEDGSITIKGIATGGNAIFYLTQKLPISAGNYYIDGGSADIRAEVRTSSGGFSYINKGANTFSEDIFLSLYIVVLDGSTIDYTVYPMLNKGNIAYPYQPYLPYLFQQAFDSGHYTGYKTGYNEGTEKAYKNIETMQKSIFETALYESTTTITTGNTTVEEIYAYDIIPNQTNEGIYFQNLRNSLINGWGENYIKQKAETTYLKMSWPTTWNWSTQSLFIQGNNLVRNAILETTNGKKYTLTASGSNSDLRDFIIQETNIEYPIEVKSITIVIDNPYDLLNNFTLLTSTKEYNLGYTEGYAKGATDNDDQQYQFGYTVGKKEGFLAGKEEGLQIANMGSWTNLFTAVAEAPINTFQSLFSFEILGLDMRVAFGAMMSICVLLIILKKVIL